MYVTEAGETEWLANSRYDGKTGKLLLATHHFSVYGIGYQTPAAFTDVAAKHWARQDITFAAAHGLLTGVGRQRFAPGEDMTRAMVWSVLYRMSGSPGTTHAPLWYADAQAWAMAEKLSDGTNPTGSVTRQELATLLYRYYVSAQTGGKKGPASADLSGFTDRAEIAAFAADGMNWAVSNGILTGNHGQLNPLGNATRAEVAAILHRSMENSIR